jgi:hypothetical protein
MPEIDRLSDGSDRFKLGSVERESTPEPAIKLDIRFFWAELSYLHTVSVLDN